MASAIQTQLPCGLHSICNPSQRRRPLSLPLSNQRHRPHALQPLQAKPADEGKSSVTYGKDWYTQTRGAGQQRTVREELERRRAANLAANKGRDRPDLYTDQWDGDKYKGNPFNILTLLVALFVLVPVAGLAFAYFTYGSLWG